MKNKTTASLLKMKEHATKALIYIENYDYDNFVTDSKTLEACIFNLNQIGELVQHLDLSFIAKYNKVDWNGIRGVRNRIIHDYKGINLQMIWELLKESLPELINDIDNILSDEERT